MRKYQITKNLSVVSVPTNFTIVQEKQLPKHIIYCVDISGSMYNDLPKLRDHLKNNIMINNEGLILSLVAFSGRKECHVLLSRYHINSLKDMTNVQQLIDRYLQPQGLTAFLQPLEAAEELILKATEQMSHNLVFMTDGYNNDSPFSEIISVLGRLSDMVDSASFIEYGYYADSKGIEKMTETVGGQKFFAKDFESYSIEVDGIIKENTYKKILFSLDEFKKDMLYHFIFCPTNNGVIIYNTSRKNEIAVNMDVPFLYYFSKGSDEENSNFSYNELCASALALLAQNKFFDAEDVVKSTGDVRLINMIQNCYGKQKLEEMKANLTDAMMYESCRYLDGQNKTHEGNASTYCLIDLIHDLSEDEECRFFPQHDAFEYNYTGRKTFVKIEGGVDTVAPEFKREYSDDGYNMSNLVLNSERANISIQVKIAGIITLPQNQYEIIDFKTFIYRNYTILKDGIVNVPILPVHLSDKLKKKLNRNHVGYTEDGNITLIDLTSLPIVTKKMVKNISAKELAECEANLLYTQSYLKFLKDFFKNHNIETESITTVSDWKKIYSGEQIEFLKSLGLTEASGYTPKVGLEEAKDFYIANTLKVKVAKFSKIPKISDVIKKVNENKKLTPSESLVDIVMNHFYSQAKGAIFENISEETSERIKVDLAKNYYTELNNKKKELMAKKAEIIFSLILTRQWFKEFSSMDENTMDVKVGDYDTTITFEFSDVEVEI